MPTFEHDGATIFYEDSGRGPAVLWSHGFLMDHTMFDPQVEALEGYRHIRWDERGFGQTISSGPFTYWDSAEDAVALLDHLGIDRAVFGGMSQGGFLSLRAALAHPQRVRALVLIDTQAGVDDAETIQSYEQMTAALAHGDAETRSGVYDAVAGLILADAGLSAAWKRKWMEREPATIVDPAACLLGRDDITDRLGEIHCPTLIVHGTEDQAIPMHQAELLRAEIVDVRDLVPVDGAAHASSLTHPHLVNPAVRQFLDTL